MASDIYERETKSGRRYDVKWRDYGHPKQHTRTFHSREAARAHVRAVELAHDQRRPYVDAPAAAPRLTLADLVTTYLRDRQRVTASRAALEQREIALSMFVGWIEALTGETPEPRHLSRTRLSDYHAWLQTPRAVEVRNVNGTTREHVYRCGVGTANARVRYVEAWWRWLADSDDYPDGTIPRPKRIDLAQPADPPPPVAPTWSEMDAAIECARPSWARLMTVMRFTGLRTTQALRLRHDDLDLDALTLRVRGELGKSKKERAGRTVPLSAHLATLVSTWPADPAGWLVVWDAVSPRYANPKREVDQDTARRILMRAKVRREVWETKRDAEGRQRNAHPLHCFRAGVISGLTGAGVDERTVQRLVGHAGSVTSDRYTDAEALAMREAVAKIPPLTTKPGARVLTLRDYTARRE